MAQIRFNDIRFFDEGKDIKAIFLKRYYFMISGEEIEKIGRYDVKEGEISIDCPQAKAERRFMFLIEEGFKCLKNIMSKKETVYVHKNSGIPLFGSGSFGIVDRGTNLIEIKPSTGCNINCIYCSVDEDKRQVDFVVEADYMIEETRRLVDFKGSDDIEIHIGCQGEPLLYTPLAELVKGISSIRGVKQISMDTNATLLTKEKVDELVDAGMTRFNVSINAFEDSLAKKISNSPYDIKKVKEICRYIAKKADIIITPVLVPTVNEDEMEKLVDFAKEISPNSNMPIGIQNFLEYKQGRNPVKQWDFEKFIGFLKDLEKKKGVKLLLGPEDFRITKTKTFPKQFRKGEIIEAEVKSKGRFKKEYIAAAKDTVITLSGCPKDKKKVRLKITRTKHGIYYGTCV